jgi:hypothetical protein
MATSVGATPQEVSVDIDQVLESDRIRRLKTRVPRLRFRPEEARVIGGSEGVVAIPANHGTALTYVKNNTEVVSFLFDEYVRGVDVDWVEGTEARLRVTADGTTLIRGATEEETETFLSSIDVKDIDRENAEAAVQPQTGEVTITHADGKERRYDRIVAEPTEDAWDQVPAKSKGDGEGKNKGKAKGLRAAKVDLEVTDHHTEQFSGESGGFTTQSGCDQDDVVFCVVEAIACIPCAAAVASGPLLAACIIFVCLGFPAVPIATALADIGCTNIAGCAAAEVVDIASDLVDEYGDDIPV